MPRAAGRRGRARRRAHARPRRGARAARAVRPGQPAGLAARAGRARSPTRARWARAATSPSRCTPAAPGRAACSSAPAAGCPPSPTSPSTPPCGSRSTAGTASVEPRLVLRHARPRRPGADRGASASPRSPPALRRELGARPGRAGAPRAARRRVAPARDARGAGIAGLLADLVAAGEPVLAVVAHAPHRARALSDRIGGFAICSWAALEDDPGLAAGVRPRRRRRPAVRRPRCVALLERPSARRESPSGVG